jgi:hypothetical protein
MDRNHDGWTRIRMLLQKSRECALENMIAHPGFHVYPPPWSGTFISRRLPFLEGVGKRLYPPLFPFSHPFLLWALRAFLAAIPTPFARGRPTHGQRSPTRVGEQTSLVEHSEYEVECRDRRAVYAMDSVHRRRMDIRLRQETSFAIHQHISKLVLELVAR